MVQNIQEHVVLVTMLGSQVWFKLLGSSSGSKILSRRVLELLVKNLLFS